MLQTHKKLALDIIVHMFYNFENRKYVLID
jgi:hypothetical protein